MLIAESVKLHKEKVYSVHDFFHNNFIHFASLAHPHISAGNYYLRLSTWT
jgi:hypothetical protein